MANYDRILKEKVDETHADKVIMRSLIENIVMTSFYQNEEIQRLQAEAVEQEKRMREAEAEKRKAEAEKQEAEAEKQRVLDEAARDKVRNILIRDIYSTQVGARRIMIGELELSPHDKSSEIPLPIPNVSFLLSGQNMSQNTSRTTIGTSVFSKQP